MARTMTMHPGSVNRDAQRWARAARLLVVCGALAVAPGAHAQVGLAHLEDATVVPRGMFRLRAITAWSRFGERFTDAGVEPLGARYTSAALGRAQLAPLGAIDSLASLASGQPFTLSLGQSRLDARGRREVVPIGVEYGLTRRITLGLVVPIVRARVAVQLRLDSTGATVGPNLHRTTSAAASTNALLQSQFAAAATQLQDRLAACRANSAAPGCAALLAREPEAQALLASSQSFAEVVGALYGTASGSGMAFVPTAGSTAHMDIALRVNDFNARYRELLGSDVLTATPVPAAGPAGIAQLQDYLTNELGGDSIATEERTGFGDVELGVKMLLLDRPADDSRRVAARATAAAVYRFGTSSTQSPSPVADLRLGDSRHMAETRVALDVQAGRLGMLAVGDAALAFEKGQTLELTGRAATAQRDSRWLGLHVAPRFHLSQPFAIHGAFSIRSADRSGAASLAGAGVSYSTLQRFLSAGGPLPLEMRFTHLEALSGPAGTPKLAHDQIEVRIYFGR